MSLTKSDLVSVRAAELASLVSIRRELEQQISKLDSVINALAPVSDRRAEKALRDASLQGDISLVLPLLTKGLDVNARDKNGATALLLASHLDGNGDLIALLLGAGADPNLVDSEKQSPLIVAVRPGQLAMVEALVEAGANVNFANDEGDTPLTNAAIWGSVDIVSHLLAHGADPNLKDGVGLTAAELALQHGHNTIADTIREKYRQSREQLNSNLTRVTKRTKNK